MPFVLNMPETGYEPGCLNRFLANNPDADRAIAKVNHDKDLTIAELCQDGEVVARGCESIIKHFKGLMSRVQVPVGAR